MQLYPLIKNLALKNSFKALRMAAFLSAGSSVYNLLTQLLCCTLLWITAVCSMLLWTHTVEKSSKMSQSKVSRSLYYSFKKYLLSCKMRLFEIIFQHCDSI